MTKKQPAGIWPLALWSVAATALLLFAATGSGLGSVQRRMLLSRPLATGDVAGMAVPESLLSGHVGGASATLLGTNTTAAFRRAHQRCRPPLEGAAPLPKLKRAGSWEGAKPQAAGNATAIVTLHMDRLPLLQAHCAVWPYTIVAAVYAPVSKARRFVCVDETPPEQLRRSDSLFAAMNMRGGRCKYAGWSLDELRARVREVQKSAQETGACNLHVELWTEEVEDELGAAAGLLPQASLQNRALLVLQQQAEALHEEHAVLLLESDMVAVDVAQLLNSSTRWERAAHEMGSGRALVLPAFQLSPPGSVREGQLGAAAELRGPALESAVKAAMDIVTAEAGKFPLHKRFAAGKARVYRDHGFRGSQDAAMPNLWFEAGDMHGSDDDGYPVKPQPGFAPFTFARRTHVPWADERLRGSYYQRAWQALVTHYMGMQHVVQPNTFALQLPHSAAFRAGEAALPNFLAMEPVFRQLVEELGAGQYVPITSFGEDCEINTATAEVY